MRKRLSSFEKLILEQLYESTTAAIRDDLKQSKKYVVDIRFLVPTCVKKALWEYKFGRKYHTVDGATPTNPLAWKTRQRWDDTGLWSLLDRGDYGRLGRGSAVRSQIFANIVFDALEYCDLLEDFSKLQCSAAPAPEFYLTDVRTCVASQRFVSEEDGGKWLRLMKETFNNANFLDVVIKFNREKGLKDHQLKNNMPWDMSADWTEEWEDAFYEEGCAFDKLLVHRNYEPLTVAFSQWLPEISLPVYRLLQESKAFLKSKGKIKGPDSLTMWTLLKLRDRGYIILQGEDRSPATGWAIPEKCLLTGVGFLRGRYLFSDN